jgi:hypothetical protein
MTIMLQLRYVRPRDRSLQHALVVEQPSMIGSHHDIDVGTGGGVKRRSSRTLLVSNSPFSHNVRHVGFFSIDG